ncbi:MAG TPA: efflux RND transporter periplasmic adaptor subunit [Vicinamibacterales bacterium]|nr:efflux RND transporter periplasmic adaptor subunit [Vicinamibacterales bacterium]
MMPAFLFRPVHARAFLALVAMAAAAAACGGAPRGAPGAGGPPGGALPPMPVQIVPLVLEPIERTTDFVATIKSRQSTTIQPQAEGFITRIAVASGRRVSPGDLLFEIDAQSQQAAVASLESLKAAREADAAFARQQAERAKTLHGVGAVSLQELEQALAQQKAAEAQLQAVEEQIRQQRAELAYYRVVAPTAGIVGDVPVRVGDRVTRTTMLTMIEDNSSLELYVSVPVQDAPRLRTGLTVRLVDPMGTVLQTTRVGFVSPSVDDATQTVLVKAPISQGNGTFRTDQYVKARMVWGAEPGLRVPVTAVSRINGQYFVFVAEAGEGGGLVARQRPVVLGPVVGNAYIALSGLAEGDRLIVAGTQKIGDGAPVQGLPAGPPSDGGRGSAPGGGA